MRTTSCRYRVHRRHINRVRSTVESYDGMAVVRTIDPEEAVIEVRIAPRCEDLVYKLLEFLTKEEKLDLVPLDRQEDG